MERCEGDGEGVFSTERWSDRRKWRWRDGLTLCCRGRGWIASDSSRPHETRQAHSAAPFYSLDVAVPCSWPLSAHRRAHPTAFWKNNKVVLAERRNSYATSQSRKRKLRSSLTNASRDATGAHKRQENGVKSRHQYREMFHTGRGPLRAHDHFRRAVRAGEGRREMNDDGARERDGPVG